MTATMIPFDSFDIMRWGVMDATHGLDVEPPVEDGEPKKGWCIIWIEAVQCGSFEETSGGKLRVNEKGQYIPMVDRTGFILWGHMKPAAAAPAPKKQEPKVEAPEDKPDPETKEEEPSKE